MHLRSRTQPIRSGDTALVTGASGGIGAEFAAQLANRGVNLILVARNVPKLSSVRTTLIERNPRINVDLIEADLSTADAGTEVFRQVSELGRHVDILINNAGAGSHGNFLAHRPAIHSGQIQLNALSLVDLTARFLPGMASAGHGIVVNVASTAAFQPTPSMAVYGATKAFVLSFTEALWQETRGVGVRILTVCPGPTETEFFTRSGEQFMPESRQTPQQVVGTAIKALSRSTPTVVSGARNRFLASCYRFVPRQIMLEVTQRMMRPT